MQQKTVVYWIHTMICLAIMFGFGFLPPIAPLTEFGMRLLGIFGGLLYGWIFIGNIWPSLAGLLALLLIGGMEPAELWKESFGNPIVVMMLFIFVFCAVINYYGLAKYISLWLITRGFVFRRPWLFTFVFLLSIAILGGLTSASPAALIGWNILYGVCEVCGYQKGDTYPKLMIFGVVFAAQLGMSMMPFKQLPLTVLSVFEGISDNEMNVVGYMLLAVVCCIANLLVFLLLLRFLFRPDVTPLLRLCLSDLDNGQLEMNGIQKLVLCFLLALVTFLILPSVLPPQNILAMLLQSIGNTGICILLVMVMCCIRVDGKALLNFNAMAADGISWGIILLLAVVQPLSAAMGTPESGITEGLLALLQPVFDGHAAVIFVLTSGAIALFLANFMNVGAVGISLMPVICTYCNSTGFAPQPAVMLVILSIHLGLLMPSASTSAALLHGNQWCHTRSIWKITLPVVLLSWLVMAAIVLCNVSLIA